MNLTKKKQTHRYKNKLVVAMGRGRRSNIEVRERRVQATGYKTDSRMLCTTWGSSQYFVITVNVK